MAPARKEPDLTTYSGRFGARLRELRIKAKLTQAELAEKNEIAQSTITHWELGSRFPSLDVLPRLAETLKLKHVRDLFPLD